MSDDSPLHDGVIVVSLGTRYSFYCANLSRTFLINPSKKQVCLGGGGGEGLGRWGMNRVLALEQGGSGWQLRVAVACGCECCCSVLRFPVLHWKKVGTTGVTGTCGWVQISLFRSSFVSMSTARSRM